MADKNSDLNLGKGDAPQKSADSKGKGGMKKIIIIVVALLAIGGGAAAYFMMGSGDASSEADAEAANAVEEVVVEEEQDPIYLALDPAFVVNFENNGTIRYLQLSLQIMSYEQDAIDTVSNNMPAVRNSLIMLFSGQDYDNLNTVDGKENLRKEVLNSIHKVVKFKGNLKINEVFFTGFVMQ